MLVMSLGELCSDSMQEADQEFFGSMKTPAERSELENHTVAQDLLFRLVFFSDVGVHLPT